MPTETVTETVNEMIAQVQAIDLKQIIPNPDQPRKTFSAEELREMAESISQDGVQTPIRVMEIDSEKKEYLLARFESLIAEYPQDVFFPSARQTLANWDTKTSLYLIAYGERRWRGSTLAGKTSIPTMIDSSMDDKKLSTIALIENMQRQEVGFIEEAKAIQSWMIALSLNPDNPKDRKAAAARLGKSGTYIHWRLDSLRLQPDIQVLANNGTLNPNQVCHLAWCDSEEQQRKLFKLITTGKCNTHTQLEAALKALKEGADTKALVSNDSDNPLGLKIVDKKAAIAITRKVESMASELVKMNASEGSDFEEGIKSMSVGELQHLAAIFNGMEKMIRSIHKNKIVYREQALLASELNSETNDF